MLVFSLPWAMKKRIWAKESSRFRMKCAFLLLCVLKRSLSVVFAIMCRHILLRYRGNWLYVAKVVKYYGIRNAYTGIFYYATFFWYLISHVEIFGFQYWRCFVILNHDAFVRPYCSASSLQNLLILLFRSFLRQRIGRLTQCHTFYIKRILNSHVDGGTQHMLRRFESLLSDNYTFMKFKR